MLYQLLRMRECVFALPLAYVGMLFYSSQLPSFRIWFFVSLAVISARSVGMSLNRVIDADIDQRNARTRHRLVASGKISKQSVLLATLIYAVVFVFSCYQLNHVCLYLSPVILFLLATYSYFKRFSSTSHLYLGLTESFAPLGGALAVHPHFEYSIFWLMGFVLFWIAGLDIIYACQDFEFDQKAKLHSIPARYGLKNSLRVSSAFHGSAFLFIVGAGYFELSAHPIYFAGAVVLALLFIWQHRLVSPKNLSQVMVAFFKTNRYISLLIFLMFLSNTLLKGTENVF